MIHAKFVTRPTRVLTWDLENRPLAYWYDGNPTSEITAFGWKWSDEKQVWTMLLLPTGEFQIGHSRTPALDVLVGVDAYRLFVSQLSGSDLAVGHNIRRHDLPMLNAALLRRQLPCLPAVRTCDTLKDYPRRGGMSASLENLAEMYGLKGKKYAMSQPAWENANRLTDDGIELARKRVTSDVVLQERLRAKLLELGLLKPPKVWAP